MLLEVKNDDSGRRLDRVLRRALPDLPLSAIHRLLRTGAVLIQEKPAGASYRVSLGETIKIEDKSARIYSEETDKKPLLHPLSTPRRATPCSLKIIFENNDLLFVRKPSGIVTHGKQSLTTFVLDYLKEKIPTSLSFLPGPLHRLDRETSGIITFSKSLKGARWFSEALRQGCIKKTYLAILAGILGGAESWHDVLRRDHEKKITLCYDGTEAAINQDGGKIAVSHVTPLKTHNNMTLVKIEISTGRTHQIRAQAAAHGFPLAGDTRYGGANTAVKGAVIGGGDFFLHSWTLEFPDNTLGIPRSLESPPPLKPF